METSKDVSVIKDEDVLRKMWQETEDFGKKKEIRSHMYKLRDERLRNFYDAEEVKNAQSTVHSSYSSISEQQQRKDTGAKSHTEALADQSFMSLKSKEIRDSASPTKEDIRYSSLPSDINGGDWTTMRMKEVSNDGKTQKQIQVASMSATKQKDNAVSSCSAKYENVDFSSEKGDQSSFMKTSGSSTKSVDQQHTVAKGDNSMYQSSQTTSSSSSKTTSHYSSSNQAVTGNVTQIPETANRVNVETYTKPDGTKVTTETFVQPDGTKITKTKYEKIQSKTSSSQKSEAFGATSVEKKSAQQVLTSHANVTDQKILTDQNIDLRQRSSVNQQAHAHKISATNVDQKVSTINVQQLDNRKQTSVYQDTGSQVGNVYRQIHDKENIDAQSKTSHRDTCSKVISSNVTVDNRLINVGNRTELGDIKAVDVITKGTENVTSTNKDVRTGNVTTNIKTSTQTNKIIEDTTGTNKQTFSDQTSVYSSTTRPDHQSSIHPIDTSTSVKPERDEIYLLKIERKIDQSPVQPISTPGTTTPDRRPCDTPIATKPHQSTDTPTSVKSDVELIYKTSVTKPDRRPCDTPIATKPYQSTDTPTSVKSDVELIYKTPVTKPEIPDVEIVHKTPVAKPQVPDVELVHKTTVVRPAKPADDKQSVQQQEKVIQSKRSEVVETTKTAKSSYDTTYKTDYCSNRISVELSPTHQYFASSLRSVSPDRNRKKNGSLKSSTSSLRSSPDKSSPERKCYPSSREGSPMKTYPSDTRSTRVSNTHTTNVTNRQQKTDDSITDTRRKVTKTKHDLGVKSRSRSVSPTTTTTSDFEFITTNTVATDLDDNVQTTKTREKSRKEVTEQRPSILEIKTKTTKKTKKVEERSSSMPTSDSSSKRNVLSPTSPTRKPLSEIVEKPKQRRKDIYEERCREILGISTNKTEKTSINRRDSEKHIYSSQTKEKIQSKKSPTKESPTKGKSPRFPQEKPIDTSVLKIPSQRISSIVQEHDELSISGEKQLDHRKQKKEYETQEFIENLKRTEEVDMLHKHTSVKEKTEIQDQEFERIPEREIPSDLPPFPSQTKEAHLCELPTQTRQSPTKGQKKEVPSPESPTKLQEFPSQIRRTPTKETTEKQHKQTPTRESPSRLPEFPSQIRRTPTKETNEKPHGRTSTRESPSKLQEFPSQIRRTPTKEPTEKPHEGSSSRGSPSKLQELSSPIRPTPTKETTEKPHGRTPSRESPSKLQEFPVQIRRTPTKETTEKPHARTPTRGSPSKLEEFPSQVRRAPTKEPCEKPERKTPTRESPSKLQEFPSHIRRTQTKDTRGKSERQTSSKPQEFPSQTRRTPSGEKPKKKEPCSDAPSKLQEFPDQRRYSVETSEEDREIRITKQEKVTISRDVDIDDTQQQRKQSPVKPLEERPERRTLSPTKVTEFPSQVRLSPTRETCEKPERQAPSRESPSKLQEFPGQVRHSPSKETAEKPKNEEPRRDTPTKLPEFLSQNEYFVDISEEEREIKITGQAKITDIDDITELSELCEQTRQSPERRTPSRESPIKLQERIYEKETHKRTSIKENIPKPDRHSPSKDTPEKRIPDKDVCKPDEVKTSPTKPAEKTIETQVTALTDDQRIRHKQQIQDIRSNAARRTDSIKTKTREFITNLKDSEEEYVSQSTSSQVRSKKEKVEKKTKDRRKKTTKDKIKKEKDERSTSEEETSESELSETHGEITQDKEIEIKDTKITATTTAIDSETVISEKFYKKPLKSDDSIPTNQKEHSSTTKTESLHIKDEFSAPDKTVQRPEPETQEFPSQIRISPEKEIHDKPKQKQKYPHQVFDSRVSEVEYEATTIQGKTKTTKTKQDVEKPKYDVQKQIPKLQEFPTQIRKSSDKEIQRKPKERVPECASQEYPSQISQTDVLTKEETSVTVTEDIQLQESEIDAETSVLKKQTSIREESDGYLPRTSRPREYQEQTIIHSIEGGSRVATTKKLIEKETIDSKVFGTEKEHQFSEYPDEMKKSPIRESIPSQQTNQFDQEHEIQVTEETITERTGQDKLKGKVDKIYPIEDDFEQVCYVQTEQHSVKKPTKEERPEKRHKEKEPTPRHEPQTSSLTKGKPKSYESPKRTPTKEVSEKTRKSKTSPKMEKDLPQSKKIVKETPSVKKTVHEDKTHLKKKTETRDKEEELIKSLKKLDYKDRKPVSEPEATKKFISVLCREEEVDRNNIKTEKGKPKDITDLESEIIDEDVEDINKTNKKKIQKEKPTQPKDAKENRTPKQSPTAKTTVVSRKIDRKATDEQKVDKTQTKTSIATTIQIDHDTRRKYAKDKQELTFTKKTSPIKTEKTTKTINVLKTDNLNKTKKVTKDSIEGKIERKVYKQKQHQDLLVKSPQRKEPQRHTIAHVKVTVQPTPKQPQTTKVRHVVSTILPVPPPGKSKPSVGKEKIKTEPTRTHKTTKTTKLSPPDSGKPKKYTHVEPELRTPSPGVRRSRSSSPSSTSSETEEDLSKTCVTTKSITVNADLEEEREVIINLQRSKSSREATPDRFSAYPCEDDDIGIPRYPDQIYEPDDSKARKEPTNLTKIIIDENEEVIDINRIHEIQEHTGVHDKSSNINRVEETDECLLSVNEKVNKFVNEAQRLISPPKKGEPAQVTLSDLNVEDRRSKPHTTVNKFINKEISHSEDTQIKSTVKYPSTPKKKPFEAKQPSPKRESKSPLSLDRLPTLTKQEDERCTEEGFATPKSSKRKGSSDEPKSVLSPTGRLRSNESIRKAKQIFENFGKADVKTSVNIKKKQTDDDVNKHPELKSTRLFQDVEKSTRKDIQELSQQNFIRDHKYRRDFPDFMKPIHCLRHGSPSPERRPVTPEYQQHDSNSHITEESTRRDTQELSQENFIRDHKYRRDFPDFMKPIHCLRHGSPSPERRPVTPEYQQHDSDSHISKKQKSPSPERRPVTEPQRVERQKSPTPERLLTIVTKKEKIETSSSRSTSPPPKQRQEEKKPITHSTASRRVKSPSPEIKPTTHKETHVIRKITKEKSPSPFEPRKTEKYIRPKEGSLSSERRTPTPSRTTPERQKSPFPERKHTSTHQTSTSSKSYDHRVTESHTGKSQVEYLKKSFETSVGHKEITKPPKGEEKEVPGYMRQLNRQPKSPYKQTTTEEIKTSQFGTTVRKVHEEPSLKTDRKVISSATLIVDQKIEDIFDLELLESLLERTTEYDLRSRIRAQIRIVKRLIAENKISHYVTTVVKTMKGSEHLQHEQEEEVSYERETIETMEGKAVKTTKTSKTPERKSPEKAQNVKTTVFRTELKKAKPVTKTVVEEKPSWVAQKNLKNMRSEKTTTSTLTKTDRVSPKKEIVVQTVQNGSPSLEKTVLDLKNGSDESTYKVHGTVVKSHYYSENGEEPVGEISITKYSSDPKDFEDNEEVFANGDVVSVTTTRRFGNKEHPHEDSDQQKVDFDRTEETTTKSKTSTFTRKGSVKEMSKKFIENAVQVCKNEKQASYPKAGLILRSSSFKDPKKKQTSADEDVSPGQEVKTVTLERVITTAGGECSNTFLTNQTKVSGVQDVITRIKNAENEEELECKDDAEARLLLNKFLGCQVLLSGMESSSSSSSRTTTIKRTITKGGKPVTVELTFTHPVTEKDLEDIWDIEILKLLLERSTDFEEQQIISARLSQVMAEQEARAEVLKKPGEEPPNATVQGESLLPLLQGLLNVPDNEQTADSGTESGEDLRGGLLNEVQCALTKLANSLKSDSSDMTPEKRNTLLQLVTKLQAGLSSQTIVQPVCDRRSSSSSGASRFVRRRQRQNRHTVGVSSEELEDARRLMEEIALREGLTSELFPKQLNTPIKKQNSEGSVMSKKSDYHPVNMATGKVPVKNAVAKPFSSSNTSLSQSGASLSHSGASLCQSGASSTAHTPSERAESPDFSTNRSENKSLASSFSTQSRSSSRDNVLNDVKKSPSSKRQSLEVDVEHNRNAFVKKSPLDDRASENESGDEQSDSESQASEEEDDSNIYTRYNQTQKKAEESARLPMQDTEQFYETKAAVVLKTNAYPDKVNSYSDATHKARENNKSYNRFNSKKLKMKRANTIDIPKPLVFYEDDDSDEEDKSPREETGFGLKGPITVGRITVSKPLPAFQPKTENDRKFMAFINKFNDNSVKTATTTAWSNRPPETPGRTAASHWGSKFGNIKKAFENASSAPPLQANARNFWKSADDAISAGKISYNGPTISRQSAKNLQKMFEEKTKQSKLPQVQADNFVTPYKHSIDENIPHTVTYRPIPKPAPINKFSHAPTSAFMPITKKNSPSAPVPHSPTAAVSHVSDKLEKPNSLDLSQNIVKIGLKTEDPTSPGTQLYLYSPKPLQKSDAFSEVKPVVSPESNISPWSRGVETGEHRVHKLVASKFEKPVAKVEPPKPRTERVAIPPTFQTPAFMQKEQVPTPYLAKSIEKKNTVRKLSDQFDNLSTKQNANVNYSNSFHYPQRSENKAFTNPYQYQEFDKSTQPQHQFAERSQAKVANLQQNFLNKSSQSNPTYVPYSHNKHVTSSVQKQDEISTRLSNVQGNVPEINAYSDNPQYTTYQAVTLNRPSTIVSAKELSKKHTNLQDYSHVPRYETKQVTETSKPRFDARSYTETNQPQKPKYTTQQSSEYKRPQFNTQVSNESVREYQAAETKVMRGPISHQAVTVHKNVPKTRDEHDMETALNIKASLNKYKQNESTKTPSPEATKAIIQPTQKRSSQPLQKIQETSAIRNKPIEFEKPVQSVQPIQPIQTSGFRFRKQVQESIVTTGSNCPVSSTSRSTKQTQPSTAVQRGSSLKLTSASSQKGSQFQKQIPNFLVNDTPVAVDALEARGKSVSKAEMWQKIVQENQSQGKPVVKSLLKSKSSNTLAVPNSQFQAGMTKEELAHKKRTIEAYFSGSGSRSPQSISRSSSDDGLNKKESFNTPISKTKINRKKTSEKVSAQSQSSGVVRSRTLPNIVCPRLLDESNIEEAFEDLFRSVA